DPETMSAPKVVAKGAGFLAARIRQIAIQNGVPIVERKPLAQALYKTVDVGQEVPNNFYQSIAEILAYVYELAGKGTRRLAKASYPPRPIPFIPCCSIPIGSVPIPGAPQALPVQADRSVWPSSLFAHGPAR